MRFYLALAQSRPTHLAPLAVAAEEAGFDGVAVSDHLLFPGTLESDYPSAPSGRPSWGEETPWPDVWVTLAHLAAVTTSVRLLSNVYVLPHRHPLHVAKAVGTAAVLSGDRVSFGVGVGWMREEFDAVGSRFEDRGERADEMIALVRKVWSGGTVRHRGRHFDLEPFSMEPAPAAPIPILVGGHSPRALRRAATLGDGWISSHLEMDEAAEAIAALHRLRLAAGRSEPFEIVTVCHSDRIDDYRERAELGVSSVQVLPWLAYGLTEAERRLDPVGSRLSLATKRAAVMAFGAGVIEPIREWSR